MLISNPAYRNNEQHISSHIQQFNHIKKQAGKKIKSKTRSNIANTAEIQLSTRSKRMPAVKNITTKKTYRNLQLAINDASTGDTLRIRKNAGIILPGTLYIRNKTRITIEGDAKKGAYLISDNAHAINIINSPGITLRNLAISSAGTAITFSEYCAGSVVEHCSLTGSNGITGSNVTNISIRNNRINTVNNYGIHFFMGGSHVIKRNIIRGGNYGINLTNVCSAMVFHNTISRCNNSGIYAYYSLGNVPNVKILNNIVMYSTTGISQSNSMNADYTIFYNNTQNHTGEHGVNKWVIDPLLDESFTPRYNSPAVDNGVHISDVNDEYNGLAPDIGAIESVFIAKLAIIN